MFSVSCFPSAKLKVDCLCFGWIVILWRFKRTPTKPLSVRRTFFLTSSKDVYTCAITWIIVSLFLNQTNVRRVNLQQWCQCGVCVFNHLLYISVCSFPPFILSCAHSVFLRGVFCFENDKRAHFLSCQRTPGCNRRWRHRRWPQFNSVN